MGKKKAATTPTTSQPALKIGSRVRCTDDGVTGKITWANGVSVKIKWDDGEEITWRRDTLATRPIVIIEADAETREKQQTAEPETAAPAAPPATEQVAPTEPSAPATEAAPEQVNVTEPQATDPATTVIPEQTVEEPATDPIPPAPEQGAAERTESTTPTLAIYTPATAASAKPKRERKAKTPAEPKEKKLSALDAAFRVLVEAGKALTCKEMIAAMAIKGYWTSPGGKTHDSTLCSAILTEIKKKGEQSRFIKAAPGRFSARPTA